MIRKMTREDMPQVLRIETNCFSDPYLEAQYVYELEDNPCAYLYVIEENKEIVGFIDFWITFESCQLCKIAVDSKYQRVGYGYQLMEYMVEVAQQQNCEIIFLEVRKSNNTAITFYKNLEFIELNVRKNYYKNPQEDAIVFGKVVIGDDDERYNDTSD